MTYKEKERQKKWFLENRERVSEQRKQYREKNRDRILLQKKEEYRRNKVKYIERAKAWSLKNPEKTRAIKRKVWKKWYEKIKATKPDYYKFRNSNHYHRMKENGGVFSQKEWLEIKCVFDNKCASCQVSETAAVMTMDHIVPLSKGGKTEKENIQPLCKSCNSKKRDKIIKYANIAMAA